MENGRIERERRQSETERKQDNKILLSLHWRPPLRVMRLDAENRKQHDRKGQETGGNRKKRGRQDSVVANQLDRRQKKRKKKEAKNAKQVERAMASEGEFISGGSSGQESHLVVENMKRH